MLQCSFKNHGIFVNLFPHCGLAVLYVYRMVCVCMVRKVFKTKMKFLANKHSPHSVSVKHLEINAC